MSTVRCLLLSAGALAGWSASSGASAQSAEEPAGKVAPNNDQEIVVTAQKPSVSVRSRSHWTGTLSVDNATNWHKLLQAPTDVSQAFRARPRTFGFQLDYRH